MNKTSRHRAWVVATAVAMVSLGTTKLNAQTPAEKQRLVASAQLDLSAIDLDALEPMMGEIGSDPSAVSSVLQMMKDSGTTELTFAMAARNFSQLNDLWISGATDDLETTSKALSRLLPDFDPQRLHGGGGKFFYGSAQVAAPIDLAGDALPDRLRVAESRQPHWVCVAADDSVRVMMADFLPEEVGPDQIGLRIAATMLRNVSKTTLRFASPPSRELELHLRCVDADACEPIERLGNELATTFLAADHDLRIVRRGEVVSVTSEGDLYGWLVDWLRRSRQSAVEVSRMNDLKQVALAMHQYYAVHEKLFPTKIQTDDGGEGLSWRVDLLPYLDQSDLFNLIDRNHSFDSKENAATMAQMPPVFAQGDAGRTRLRLPVIQDGPWAGDQPRSFADIIDGTSNTIALAIAPEDAAVVWTKPETWQLDESSLLESFFGGREEALVAMFDGSARKLKKADLTEEKLRALLTHAGRELVDF